MQGVSLKITQDEDPKQFLWDRTGNWKLGEKSGKQIENNTIDDSFWEFRGN